MDDVLSPLVSAEYITKHGDAVKIRDEGVQHVAKMIADSVEDGTFSEVEFIAHALHPKDGGKFAVDWVFFMDTINFSFWPNKGEKYDVSYKGTTYTGYFAACAALNKAIDAGIDAVNSEWMSNATLEQVDDLFRADSGHSIPLLEERVKALNESGRVLREKFNGSFNNCVLAAEEKADKLLSLIVENFQSFRDFATFKGKRVSLLKRAQILVADVFGALKCCGQVGNFKDIEILTMFADYRVPQALAYLGALKYSSDLLNKLKDGIWLENGSEEEVQLRGASIYACQKIVEAITAIQKPGSRKMCAADVDIFIWVYRRKHAVEIEKSVPFHRTRCIYY